MVYHDDTVVPINETHHRTDRFSETIEVDAIDHDVRLNVRPEMDGSTAIHVSPCGPEANNITLMIEPNIEERTVALNSYIDIELDGEKLEVIAYLTIRSRRDARLLADALLSAFPKAEKRGK